MNKRTIILNACVLAACLASCTKDPAFNEDNFKNINSNMTLFEEGVALPCDTTVAIKLEEVIKPSEQIVCDADGKYYVKAEGKIGEKEIQLPEVKLQEKQMFSGSTSIPTGALSGKTVKDVCQKICTMNATSMISITGDIPEDVVDIKDALITSNNKVVISANSSLCCLKKDFKVIFEKGLEMEMNEQADWYTVETDSEGRNVIRLLKDVTASPDVKFNLSFTEIEVQSGWIKNGKLSVNAPVILTGDVYAIGSGVVPSEFKVNYYADLSGNKVNEVICKLNIKSEISGKTIDIELPESLKKDAKVIFNNPELIIHIVNGPGISMNASLDITASKGGVAYGKVLKITIPGNTDEEYDYAINEKSCPGFTDMISFLPDKITIGKAALVSDANTWVDVLCNGKSTIAASYATNIPLELKKGSYISFKQEKKVDVKLDGLEITQAEIAMALTNNLPATLAGTLKIIIDGVQYDVKTDKELTVAPGATVDLKATISTSSPFKTIETLIVDAKASVTDDVASLNKNQSAAIRLKSFNFPKGITVK